MAEPKTRADRFNSLFPWLLHWGIEDERIGGFRSDAYAVRAGDGLVIIDALPLTAELEAEWQDVSHIFMTHANHQRSSWRLRRELGVPVYAPVGDAVLDEEPDMWFDETTTLPDGLQAIRATSFEDACYLMFAHAEGTRVLFCGDLICHEPDGPYRFPVQPGYFDAAAGEQDTRRLLELSPDVLCAAHAAPQLNGCQDILVAAIDRQKNG